MEEINCPVDPASLENVRALLSSHQYKRALDSLEQYLTLAWAPENLKNCRYGPLQYLVWMSIKIYCLMRLREYQQCSILLESLGCLDDPQWCYETYPESERRGSVAPFCLRLFNAYLPLLLGLPSSCLDRLYALLGWCTRNLDSASQTDSSVWLNRLTTTVHILAEIHVTKEQYQDALELLQNEVLFRRPQHIPSLIRMGRISVQTGAMEAAEEYFGMAECLSNGQEAFIHVNQ